MFEEYFQEIKLYQTADHCLSTVLTDEQLAYCNSMLQKLSFADNVWHYYSVFLLCFRKILLSSDNLLSDIFKTVDIFRYCLQKFRPVICVHHHLADQNKVRVAHSDAIATRLRWLPKNATIMFHLMLGLIFELH